MSKSKSSSVPHHMRLAALQCNFEGGDENTVKVVDKWTDMGFNSEQLFHTHAGLYSALYDETKHKELLSKYLKKAKDKSLAIILYMNCHILLPYQEVNKEQWCIKNKDGSFAKLYSDCYYTPCLNSPWDKFFLGQLEKLKGFDLGGIFFDGPVLLDCYCPVCRAKFLKERGKSMDDATKAEISSFSRRTFLDFSQRIYDKVKEVNPNWLAYTNLGIMHGQWSVEEMREILGREDIIGTEGGFLFYGQPRQAPPFRCSLSAKTLESVADGRPTVIFMAGDHKSWCWYLHTPTETKLCYASTIANGASVWYGIHCSTDMLESAAGDAAREMLAFDKKLFDAYPRTESVAEIAVLFSLNTAKNYNSSHAESDFYGSGEAVAKGIGNYLDGVNGIGRLLTVSSTPFDIVTELASDRFSDYKTIIVPNAACLDGKTAKALDKFVRDGGTLIADGETSLFDERMGKQDNFSMAKTFGVKFSGSYRKYNRWDYFVLMGAKNKKLIDDKGVKRLPAPFAALDVAFDDDVETVANACVPLKGCYAGKPDDGVLPFISKKKLGKGVAYYIAGCFFEMYENYCFAHYNELIRKLAFGGKAPLVELLGAPQGVEMTIRKAVGSKETLVMLVNYTGAVVTRPLANVAEIRGATLKLRKGVKSARSARTGKALKINDAGEICLPPFMEYEAVIIS